MNEETNARVITLKDLWDIFAHRWWFIIGIALICVAVLFAVNCLTFVPEYSSTATLYILRQDNDEQTSADSDFSLALKVVNDCTYLLKSHAVVDKVIDNLSLEMDYEDLSEQISTNNPENTRILEVTVIADSPQNAKRIVDSLCRIGQDKIADAMGFQQVNLYEFGTLDDEPSNKFGVLAYALALIIAAVIVYLVLMVKFLLDDRIMSEEDIENYLGLSLLGDIPNADTQKKNKYGYYAKSGNKEKAYGRHNAAKK